MVNNNKAYKILSLIRRLIVLVQGIITLAFLIILSNTDILPGKAFLTTAIVIVILFALCFIPQFFKNRIYVLGVIISLLLSVCMVFGMQYLRATNSFMHNLAATSVKTDNMVVVVKDDNPAEDISAAANYRFGTQTAVDVKNTNVMIDKVNEELGKEIYTEEYSTFEELGEALLKGSISAAIYNEAYEGIIEDLVEGYAGNTRVIYRYGIETKLDQKTKDSNDVSEPFNIYISGIDARDSANTNSRSDANLIMTVNPKTKEILLTTVPRDYYVEIPGITGANKDKLTHAGIYGIDKSVETLENLYDIEIKYYVRVNFEALINLVDILGGISVQSDQTFTTTHGSYEIKRGINRLSGEEALAFVRERYAFEDGDNQRGKNQQKVLTAILKKMLSKELVTNYGNILDVLGESMQTDMTKDEMSAIVKYHLETGFGYGFTTKQAKGTGDTQACYSSGITPLYVMQPDEASIVEVKNGIEEVLNHGK